MNTYSNPVVNIDDDTTHTKYDEDNNVDINTDTFTANFIENYNKNNVDTADTADTTDSNDTTESNQSTDSYSEYIGTYIGKSLSFFLNSTSKGITTIIDSTHTIMQSCQKETDEPLNRFLNVFKQK
jgi:hypothetical protein